MLLNILILIVGFVLLSKGADVLVDGASAMAKRFKIPEIVIGLTIVACGTSAPEAAVSISSVINGASSVGIGNILGSNIANILLILGVSAIISNLYVQKNTILYEIPFLCFISVLLMFMGFQYGVISHLGASLLCLLFLLFGVYLYFISKNQKPEASEIENMSVFKMICFIILGIIGLVIGAKLTINSATEIARILNVSERIIGLTIVAFGTSLPELVTCISAALKKHSDIVIGNIIGSNLFNILFVLGITGLISPIPFESVFLIDSAIGIVATILLWVFVIRDKKLTRIEGFIFFVLYILYVIYLI
ncbi:MAG: calcium/sodium antiporter, partial [Alphaproteobacteria bacterium]|nr:calcium/sodium antiporter [Alphaproteobacteria bacterium]